ncbi:choice-of-anchor D domain-containing protein [Baekduia sp.]|jgi:iron transport multicopper oxidase|uniref:choice-of-anchor D domain-containing protein n=1 Tax=Baekduia sp. TaxID=2600305 RepID=UPI002E089F49|nr:choice-of-anchor D domain-containing protein [Baekduia sp.]
MLRRTARALCAAAIVVGALGSTSVGASAAGITNSGGDLRDGWYGDQPKLSPDAVAGSNFGKLWDAPVDGQVYAQPLVVDTGVNKKSVIVATERNEVSSFDAETGDKNWSVNLGPSYPANLIGCGDLNPDLGVTATPVIDTATNTVYLTHKTYDSGTSGPAAYYVDALDVATGEQRSGFPRKLTGTAQNAPGISFDATQELQRPGLLLLDGVVYAGFGGHCDFTPYQGWVFGVNTSGDITARWSAVASGNGAGIWQSGAGLMSDGPGRIFLSTGNGGSPTPPLAAPGNGMYGESIVRLDVQTDGTLKPMDFFAPSDAAHLDDYDADFASGGVTALRDSFGTSQFPHLGVAVGKAGYVYLLNRDDLGGIGTGDGRGDRVVSRVGPYGGVWSRPGIWPGDGGWIAIPTASPSGGENPSPSGSSGYLKLYRYRVSAAGVPSLDAPVQSDDAFGFGSSAPVITSDGTTSGSAVLWIVWSPDGGGAGAQLRAYDAVPRNGHLNLRHSWPIGQATKFAMPGVGDGRIYVGTRDGHIQAYGAPVEAQVSGPSTTFPLTTVGTTSTVNVKLTISGTVKVNSIVASSSPFVVGTPTPAVPATLVNGDTITIPVDFTPTAPGSAGGMLTVDTDKGPFSFSLTATGQAQAAVLTASPPIVSFGGAVVGDSQASVVTFGNGGGQPLTVTAITLPGAPFSVDDTLAAGTVIGPGEAINVTVHYQPTVVGEFSDDLVLDTTAGEKTVGLSGIAGLGPKLTLTPAGGWDFGTVTIGESKTVAVTMSNTGDSPMNVTKSKPPTNARFTVLDPLDEGTSIPAGESRTLRISFTPTDAGAVSDKWIINAGDGSGVHEIAVTGTGQMPATQEPEPEPEPPPVVGPVPPVPDVAPMPPGLGPEVTALSRPELIVEKLRPALSVTKAQLSRDGRKLVIRGRVTAAAVGPLSVQLSARAGRRTVTSSASLRLRGHATYTITMVLPKAARRWTRLQIVAHFPGSERVWPGTGSLVLVRGR